MKALYVLTGSLRIKVRSDLPTEAVRLIGTLRFKVFADLPTEAGFKVVRDEKVSANVHQSGII